MINKILSIVLAAISAVVLVALALANRHIVTLVLDPFNPKAPAVEVPLPFYVFLFAMLLLGVVVGGMSVWLSQGKWRRTARHRTQEAMRWKGEVDRLTRERDSHVAAARQFASATPGQGSSSGAPRSLAIAGR